MRIIPFLYLYNLFTLIQQVCLKGTNKILNYAAEQNAAKVVVLSEVISKKMAENKDIYDESPGEDRVLQSRFFKLAMAVARKYAYSRSRLFVLLSQAFAKLRDKATKENLQRDFLPKLNLFLRMIRAYASGEYKELPTTALIKIVAAVVYFVMVIDFIPDFIPVLGFADDLAVILWVYKSIDDQMLQFQEWENSTARIEE